MAKTVCAFIGAQAQVQAKGGRNPLVQAAYDIDILGHADDELEAMRGPRVADRLEDDPRFGRVAADPDKGVEADNGQGSYEGFLSMFGAPAEASTADA